MAKLGEMLVSEGLLTAEQLDEALSHQRQNNGFLGDILVERGLLPERTLVEVLVRQTGSPSIELAGVELDMALAEKVPEKTARRYRCIPVKQTANVLHVAMANPGDDRAVDSLAFQSGCTIKTFVTGSAALEPAWVKLYGNGSSVELAQDTAGAAPPSGSGEQAPEKLPELAEITEIIEDAIDQFPDLDSRRDEGSTGLQLELGSSEPPVIRLVNGMLVQAVQMGASDIHIEPMEDVVRVRFRIDGSMVAVLSLPGHIKQPLASRIKILAGMDISEKRIPQDGRFKLHLTQAESVDFRVNALPGIHGEKVVIRILGQGDLLLSIDQLGFVGRNLEIMREAIRTPIGMILVTGPTGSGKTTTLYTILSSLNQEDVNIVTAEDPVEYHLSGITQVNVRPSIGFTFDVALRAFLRQDPDIILVGEIRDFETAHIATKAALTGHLVLSTLHTNDCPSTVVRMADMGIEPYLVASAVKVVVAQRLLRRLCQVCRVEQPIGPEEEDELGQSSLGLLEKQYVGKGCEQCNGLGYKGRAPVFEVMAVRTKDMKRIITEGATEIHVAQVARREGMRTLRDEALRMVNEGQTSLAEALKIIMSE